MKFEIGDFVSCHPMGIGKIVDIETKRINDDPGGLMTFYVIKDYFSDTTLLIPIESSKKLRALPSAEEIEDLFDIIKDSSNRIKGQVHVRYVNCAKKVKTGQLRQIAEVVSSLFFLNRKKNISVSERKLLNDSKAILAREIAISLNTNEDDILKRIDQCA